MTMAISPASSQIMSEDGPISPHREPGGDVDVGPDDRADDQVGDVEGIELALQPEFDLVLSALGIGQLDVSHL